MTKPQIKILDKLWSEKVRSRGMCLHCETTENLQAHHIVSKRHRATRWHLPNGMCLCYRCHIHWVHADTVEGAEWIKDMVGAYDMKRLQNRSRDIDIAKSLDFEKIKAELEAPRKQRRKKGDVR